MYSAASPTTRSPNSTPSSTNSDTTRRRAVPRTLFALGALATKPNGRTIGLYHLAWQVDTIDELADAQRTLDQLGALTGQSSHGATKSVYGIDPDGNEFQIMWLLPYEAWGEYEHAAPVKVLDMAAETDRWTGHRTASEPGRAAR